MRHVQAQTTIGQRPDRFLIRMLEPLPDLWADPDKVDQVLGNLLENAVRHGEGTVTIEVGPVSDATSTEGTSVTVSDEGPGIPEESMSRVFTRFWRGSKRGGTGLGLYIVKGIVEAHGGTITVGRAPRLARSSDLACPSRPRPSWPEEEAAGAPRGLGRVFRISPGPRRLARHLAALSHHPRTPSPRALLRLAMHRTRRRGLIRADPKDTPSDRPRGPSPLDLTFGTFGAQASRAQRGLGIRPL